MFRSRTFARKSTCRQTHVTSSREHSQYFSERNKKLKFPRRQTFANGIRRVVRRRRVRLIISAADEKKGVPVRGLLRSRRTGGLGGGDLLQAAAR